MAVKAIFSECSIPTWLNIAQKLNEQYDWIPCYWIGAKSFEKSVKKQFPNVVFHANADAVRGIPAPGCHHLKIPPLDQPLLDKLAFYELIALRMMNRMDRNNAFNFEEREHLFHKHVKYWSGVLNHFNPDVIISPVSPHLIYDYILYRVAKIKKIKHIMFVQIAIDGWIYPVETFEEGSLAIKSSYDNIVNAIKKGKQKYPDIKLSNDAELHLKKITGDYTAALPFYMKDQFEQNRMALFLIKKVLDKPNDIYNMVKKVNFLFSREHYIKKKGKSLEESNIKGLDYLFYKLEGKRKKDLLKAHYKKLEKKVDLNQPYLYFPLHYQPENSSSPAGEIYADQFLIIDMLSKCMPEGWNLYVKEHSSQWHLKLHGECSRTIDFYDEIASLPKVKFISLSTPNFELIDHAKAVITITGTSGWESVVRGVPVLIFGHAWYKGCEGVFYTPSKEECKLALSKIESGYKVDHELVKLFVHVLEKNCIKAYVSLGYEKVTDVTPQENVSILINNIQKFYTNISSSLIEQELKEN